MLPPVDEEVPGACGRGVTVHAVARAMRPDQEPLVVATLVVVALVHGVGQIHGQGRRDRVAAFDARQRLKKTGVEHVQRRRVGILLCRVGHAVLGFDPFRIVQEGVQEDFDPAFPAHVHLAPAPSLLHPLHPRHGRSERPTACHRRAVGHVHAYLRLPDHAVRHHLGDCPLQLKGLLAPGTRQITHRDMLRPHSVGGLKCLDFGDALEGVRIHLTFCGRSQPTSACEQRKRPPKRLFAKVPPATRRIASSTFMAGRE